MYLLGPPAKPGVGETTMCHSKAAAIIALVITLIVGQEAMAAQTLEEIKQDC
jgi:hypothetical protein